MAKTRKRCKRRMRGGFLAEKSKSKTMTSTNRSKPKLQRSVKKARL
jgi:hypothetical protein